MWYYFSYSLKAGYPNIENNINIFSKRSLYRIVFGNNFYCLLLDAPILSFKLKIFCHLLINIFHFFLTHSRSRLAKSISLSLSVFLSLPLSPLASVLSTPSLFSCLSVRLSIFVSVCPSLFTAIRDLITWYCVQRK